MASAPSLPLVSIEEYLRTSYEPECEYVDGVLVPKELPKRTHVLLQRLLTLLLEQSRVTLDLDYYAELRIAISDSRVRIPDFAVFEGVLREEVAKRAPLLTIEIASDTESLLSLKAKLRDHLSMGTRLAVIVDPEDHSVLIQDQDGLRSVEGAKVIRLETRKGVFEIDFDNLFSQMDKLNAE